MKTVELTRCTTSDKGTFGILSKEGLPLCVTCELPWKYNEKKKSCVPVGKYVCKPYTSSRFPEVWELQDVRNRSAILIHWGNTIEDIEGCILVGRSFAAFKDAKGDLIGVTNSKLTYEQLRKVLPNEFTLVIRQAY